jgi:hypothetical protein
MPADTRGTTTNTHRVVHDIVGMRGSCSRYTCMTCEGATLVRQPYMSHDEWVKRLAVWLEAHPCDSVENEGWRGG